MPLKACSAAARKSGNALSDKHPMTMPNGCPSPPKAKHLHGGRGVVSWQSQPSSLVMCKNFHAGLSTGTIMLKILCPFLTSGFPSHKVMPYSLLPTT